MEATAAGFGITRLLSSQVAPQLTEGRLNVLLAEFEKYIIPLMLFIAKAVTCLQKSAVL